LIFIRGLPFGALHIQSCELDGRLRIDSGGFETTHPTLLVSIDNDHPLDSKGRLGAFLLSEASELTYLGAVRLLWL
jgi:hypothetical protein